MRTSYPGVRVDGSSPPRETATIDNNVLAGRLNVILELDVAAGATGTTVQDDRLTETVLVLAPVGSTVTDFTWVSPGVGFVAHAAGVARVEPLVLVGG